MSSERVTQRRARKVAAVIVLLMGMVLFFDRVELVRYGLASSDWPTVTGEVTEFEARSIGDARTGRTWSLRVSYKYQVEGQEYSSSRLSFARSLPPRDQAQIDAALERLQPGRSVTVYHHPHHHELSVLEAGLDRSGWLGMVLAVLLMAVAVIFWVVPTKVVRGETGQGAE